MKKPREKKTSIRDYSRIRLICVGGLFALAYFALWYRAVDLQLVQGPALAEMAERQYRAQEFDHGARGEILDRNGLILAKSVEFMAIYAQPKDFKDPEATLDTLSKLMEIPKADLKKKIGNNHNFAYLARHVPDKIAVRVKEAALPGIHVVTEWGRSYPNRHLAGQLLGFVGFDDQGLEGLEKSFEQRLAGKKAKFVAKRDANGRVMYLDSQGEEMQNIKGGDVKLTIDSQIQYSAEEALAKAVTENKGKAGICIVVHVPTAEILAWANYPFFNPNSIDRSRPEVSRNRLALDVIEPGSTMKPLVIAAALQEGTTHPDKVYDCERGQWTVNYATIRDTHSYDKIPVNKILRFSSNIGAAKIGTELGANKLHSYFEKLGFGDRMGLSLPGETRGLLRPVNAWSKVDLATASFGQGVGVTPAQLAQAFLCLANDGVAKPLKLFLDPAPDPALDYSRRVFDSKVAQTVQRMMREVVEEEKGTGVKAHIEGLDTGGKTGTAQKAKPRGGYGDKYLASFVGFVPALNPEFVILVMVDEPEPCHYGGVVSAPAVREVALRTLSYMGKLPESVRYAEDRPNPQTTAQTGKSQPGVQASAKQTAQAVAAKGQVQPAQAGLFCPPPEAKMIESAVPNFVGMPLRRVVEILASRGIMPALKGQGMVVGGQQPAAGTPWPEGENEVFTLWLNRAS